MFIRAIAIVLIVIVASATQGIAQQHPETPGATLVENRIVDSTLPPIPFLGTARCETWVTVWRNSNQQISATIDVASSEFSGSGAVVDSTTTAGILESVRLTTIVNMLQAGHIVAGSIPNSVRLYHDYPISRSGTGTETVLSSATNATTYFFDYAYQLNSTDGVDIIMVGSGPLESLFE